MRRMRRSALVLAIALTLLIAGAENSLAKSSPGHHGRSAKKAGGKNTSGRIGRRGRDRRGREASGKRRRGRYARSRRGRNNIAQETSGIRVSPGIPSDRITEIQGALIKLGYLSAPASGQYDDATTDAMKRFQTDNQLQTTGLPSAYTLKRLGVSKRVNDGYVVQVNRSN